MWFFWRKRKKTSRIEKLIAGIIIGGAIGGVVGKKLLEKMREERGGDDEEQHE